MSGSHRVCEVDGEWEISFLTFLIVYFSFYISYGCHAHACVSMLGIIVGCHAQAISITGIAHVGMTGGMLKYS